MPNVSGIAASAGIAIARAFILEHPDYSVEKRSITDVDAEIAKLEAALEKSEAELQAIKARTLQELGEKKQKFLNLTC